MSHTPEPWIHHQPGSVRICDGRHESTTGCQTITEAEVLNIAHQQAVDNAARVVACINSCAGLNPAAYRECVAALKSINLLDVKTTIRTAITQAIAHAEAQS